MLKHTIFLTIAFFLCLNVTAQHYPEFQTDLGYYMKQAVELQKNGKLTPEHEMFEFPPLSKDIPKERFIDSLFRKGNSLLDEQGDCFEGYYNLTRATIAAEAYYGIDSETYAEYFVYHHGKTFPHRCNPENEYELEPWLKKEYKRFKKQHPFDNLPEKTRNALNYVERMSYHTPYHQDFMSYWRDTIPQYVIDELGTGHIGIIYSLEKQINAPSIGIYNNTLQEGRKVLLEHYDDLIRHYEAAYGHLSWQRLDAERRRIMAYRERSYTKQHPGYNDLDLRRARQFMIDWDKAGLVKTFAYWEAVYEIGLLEYVYSQDAVRAAYLISAAYKACEYRIHRLFDDTYTFPSDYNGTHALLEANQITAAKQMAMRETMYCWRSEKKIPPELKLEIAYAEQDWDSCDSLAAGILDRWKDKVAEEKNTRVYTPLVIKYLKPLAIWAESRLKKHDRDNIDMRNIFDGLPIEILDVARDSVMYYSYNEEWETVYSLSWKREFEPEVVAELDTTIWQSVDSRIKAIKKHHFANVSKDSSMYINYLLHAPQLFSTLGAWLYKLGLSEKGAKWLAKAKLHIDMLDELKEYVIYQHRDEKEAANAIRRYHLSLALTPQDNRSVTFSRKIFERQKQKLRDGFARGVKEDRNGYYNLYHNLFTYSIAIMPVLSNELPGVRTLAYDNALFVKGLQLNAELSLTDFLLKNGDTETLKKLRQLQTMEVLSAKDEERKRRLEREVVDRSLVYGDYTNGLFTTWQQVRDALASDEAAVEFIEVHAPGGSLKNYYSLTLLPGIDAPRYDYIGKEEDLSNFDFSTIYSTDSLSKKVWTPVIKHLDGVRTVYFSPAGIFNSIALEHLPMPTGSSRRNLYRLSSTRQLCNRSRKKACYARPAVFGGVDFDGETLAGQATTAHRSYNPYDIPDSAYIENLGLRAGFGYLPGTLNEATSIAKLLGSKRASLFTGAEASENRFKSLSGSGIDLLHVATHGFYWSERDIRRSRNIGHLNRGDDMEDRALNRSGILLAGANKTLRGDASAYPDDGILTAKELSTLDLSSVKLAVMSACQTGLGDVSAEGVFGLQRGLKKSGVQSILMSLWKVDDEATRVLMTEFYSLLKKGKAPRESLNLAQQRLKAMQGYESPEFWAGFVLLD